MAIEVDLFRWLTGSGIPRLQDGESLEADLSASRKDGLGLVRTGRLVVTSSQLLFRPYLPIFLQVPPVSVPRIEIGLVDVVDALPIQNWDNWTDLHNAVTPRIWSIGLRRKHRQQYVEVRLRSGRVLVFATASPLRLVSAIKSHR